MRNGLAKQIVLSHVALFENGKLGNAGLLQFAGLGQEAVALGMEDGAHICLGDRGNRAQHALFAATRAGAVARYQRVVVGAHHQHVAQRSGLRVSRVGCVEQAKKLLRGIGQQIQEARAGLVFGIHLFGLCNHPQRVVIAAGRDAGRAALAQIADKDREDAA